MNTDEFAADKYTIVCHVAGERPRISNRRHAPSPPVIIVRSIVLYAKGFDNAPTFGRLSDKYREMILIFVVREFNGMSVYSSKYRMTPRSEKENLITFAEEVKDLKNFKKNRNFLFSTSSKYKNKADID